jgi:sugar phosphate isomerase/epimerase
MFTRRQLLTNAAKVAGLGAAATLLPINLRELHAEDTAKPFAFKYAICNELFGDRPFDKAFAFAVECGYTGVEIAPFTLAKEPTKTSAFRRAKTQHDAKQAGLEVVGLHWLLAKTEGFHLTSPDASVRRKTADYFGELANLCADLGGRIMVLGSPKQRDLAPGVTKEQGMKYAAEVLQTVAPTLEKTKVVIALEPLAPVETNFLTSVAEGAELVKLVASPTCRLHFDCKAMSGEKGSELFSPAKISSQYIPDLIRKYHKIAVHFHANDPNRQGPGFGKIDFVPILKALAEVNYTGWVSVEPIDYAPGVEKLARDSIAYLKRCAARSGGG